MYCTAIPQKHLKLSFERKYSRLIAFLAHCSVLEVQIEANATSDAHQLIETGFYQERQ